MALNYRFRDLRVGDTFDFINDENRILNSFYERVRKTSARKYETLDGTTSYRVGSVYAVVYHVERA